MRQNRGTIWTLLIAVSATLTASRGMAADPHVHRIVTVASQVSDHFRQEVTLASRSIPAHVWNAVEQSGWQVRMAEFVVDAAPSLKGRHPRGWPRSTTWNNSDAVHLPHAKLLVLAEKRRTTSGQVVSSDRVPGVLRHEFGHAFDFADPGPHGAHSRTPGFVASYCRDVEALTSAQRKPLRYYLQTQRAGRQETFAEAFAIVLGGGSDTASQDRFAAAFPHVIGHVKQVLQAAEMMPR